MGLMRGAEEARECKSLVGYDTKFSFVFRIFLFFLLLLPGWTFHSVNSVDEIEAFQFHFWG